MTTAKLSVNGLASRILWKKYPEKTKRRIKSEKSELENLLNASLERELSDKDFEPIRADIINSHINAIPDSELKKRNSEYKRKMGDTALSRLLSELGLPYEISSHRKNNPKKEQRRKKQQRLAYLDNKPPVTDNLQLLEYIISS